MAKISRSSKKASAPTYANPAEVEAAHTEIASLVREIEAQTSARDEAIAKLEAESKEYTDPRLVRIEELAAQIYEYAQAHRTELTNHGTTKTAPFGAAGMLQWATSPPRVVIEDVDKVLETLERLKLTAFIRRPPPEINREAILEDQKRAQGIAGVTIARAENVYVRPSGVRAYVVSTLGKRGKPGKWRTVWPKDEQSS